MLDADDFGLQELAAGEDATPVFRRALEACKREGADGLRIPQGEWHLYPDYAFGRRMAVANNDRGIKRTVFLLEGLDRFALDASGARFVCHGEMIPISVDDSRNVRLSGFSIDWATPFYLQGRVTAVHPGQNAFDLQIHDENHYQVRGSRLIFRGKPPGDANEWKGWAPLPTERKTWERNLHWNVWFDGESRHPLPAEHLWSLEPDPRVEELEPGVVRVFDALPHLPEIGWVLVVKGMGSPNRTSPAIRLARSQDLVLEDITLHHAGGMGVIGQRCENVRLSRLKVELPKGKSRFVTTTADATHFNGCRGDIVIEDCLFENMLDDSTNVHGCFLRVEKQTSRTTFLCRLVHSQQRGLKVVAAGERLRFVENEAMQPYGEATVNAVRVLNDDIVEIDVDRLPDGGLRPGSAAYNLSWQPNVDFRRSTARNNRGRSMLIATSGRVRIEGNTFERSTLAGIQFEGDNHYWWESAPTKNVFIRGNRFRDVMGHVLRMVPHIDAAQHPDALYHGGITFEDNVIHTYHRRLIHGKAIDGLVIRNNRILASDYLYEPVGPEPSLHFESGKGIVVEGNQYESTPPLAVRADTASALPQMRENVAIELQESTSESTEP